MLFGIGSFSYSVGMRLRSHLTSNSRSGIVDRSMVTKDIVGMSLNANVSIMWSIALNLVIVGLCNLLRSASRIANALAVTRP